MSMKETMNRLSSEKQEDVLPNMESLQKETSLENPNSIDRKSESSETDDNDSVLEGKKQQEADEQVDNIRQKIEEMQNDPEIIAYTETVRVQMEEELEGMDFDPDAEVVERPQKAKIAKAMMTITAGVMLWIASTIAAPSSVEAKDKNYGFADIFDSKKASDKLKNGTKKAAEKVVKDSTKQLEKDLARATKKAVGDILGSIFK